MVRARKEVGRRQTDFAMAYYPKARLIKDDVFITCGVWPALRIRDGRVEFASTQRRLIIRPTRWPYERQDAR